MIFIATNIVIEYLKNNSFLECDDFEDLFINDIVVMELYQGARNKSDLAFIKKNCCFSNFEYASGNHHAGKTNCRKIRFITHYENNGCFNFRDEFE